MSRKVVIFTNGINTRGEGVIDDWPMRAVRWTHANTANTFADRYSYHVGTFEKSLEEERHADNLAELIRQYQKQIPGCSVIVAAHSEGAAIACLALANHPDLAIDDLHLIQGACLADCGDNGNGLNGCVDRGQVKRIAWYTSNGDTVLKFAGKMRWLFKVIRTLTFGKIKGYPNGGYTGPTNRSDKSKDCMVEYRDDSQSHSSRFADPQFEITMQQVNRQIEVVPTIGLPPIDPDAVADSPVVILPEFNDMPPVGEI